MIGLRSNSFGSCSAGSGYEAKPNLVQTRTFPSTTLILSHLTKIQASNWIQNLVPNIGYFWNKAAYLFYFRFFLYSLFKHCLF